jgi:iron complex outermembrane receptor protein
MRRGVLLLIALAAWSAAPAAAQQATATLSGTVTDAATGRPIAVARVMLLSTLLVQETDSAGRFRFTLPAGTYRLRAAALGYASDTLPALVLAAGDTRSVAVALHAAALELPTMVVTASRRVESIEEAQVSVAVVARDEVLRRNVLSVDRALAFVPGVTMNGTDNMDIRGATGIARGVGSRVLMLLDGHPTLSADGGEILWESLPLLDLDQIEVVKGAYSALYGSNALGGVVNLLTTRLAERPQTVARAYYGAYTPQSHYDYTSSTLSTQGVNLQHSRWLGSVGTRIAVLRETSDGYTQNGDYDRWAARAKLASRPDAANPWDLYAVWSRNQVGEFFTWRDSTMPYEVKPEELGDYRVQSQVLTGATVTPIATSGVLLRISPFLNWNENTNYFHDNDNWHQATKVGASAALALLPGEGNHAVTMGLDGAWTGVRSNFVGSPGIVDGAVFLQDEIRFTDKFRGTLGARLDYHFADGGEPETSVNPKASVVVIPSDRVSVRASLARGYRAPSAIEQFVSTIQYGIKVIPNPDLRGEQAWSAEVGATAYPWRRLRVDGAVFQSQYDDLIAPSPAPGQFFVFQFQNVAKARVRGIDVGMHAQLAADVVNLQATYLYLDSEDEATGKALPYRSRHNVTGTLDLLRGLLGVDLIYRSRVEEVLAYPADPRGTITTMDFRAAYKIAGVALQAKVTNLFNSFYTDVQERSPGAPRGLGLSVFSEF